MVVAVLAFLALAVTAAVVIRDAHPEVVQPVPETPLPAAEPASLPEAEPASERDSTDFPTEAVDMTQLVMPEGFGSGDSFDAPTQSMPMPVSFAGAQAAAILPYPTTVADPAVQPEVRAPAAFVPAGTPHLQPDPDRLIQTEIVIEDAVLAHRFALTRLAIGLAVSGAVVGLSVIGIARGIALLVHTLAG